MTWKLSTFDDISLPTALPELPVGGGPSVDSIIQLPSGKFFDAYQGDNLPVQMPYEISYRAIARGTSAANLETTVGNLKKLRGKRASLKRTMADSSEQWCTARMRQVSSTRLPENTYHLVMDFTFQVQTPWYGARHGGTWYLDDGYYLDNGKDLDEAVTLSFDAGGVIDTSCTNSGNISTDNIVLKVTNNGSNNIIWLAILAYVGNHMYIWDVGVNPSGLTVAQNEYLEVDCGARTVTVNGTTDAYYYFRTVSGHTSYDWLRFDPGVNYISAQVGVDTGTPDADLQISYYDTYE